MAFNMTMDDEGARAETASTKTASIETASTESASSEVAGISVRNLSFAYPECDPVLKGLNLTIAPGARVLLAGATGSGKSTLLRCLKPELTPHGTLLGEVLVDGLKTQDLNAQASAGRIGFVMQDPRQQIVMDTVKAELAFGLENLGTPPSMIQRRVAEIAHYFGINAWVDRLTSELSGGEMQVVNLAAIIAMKPRALLLDEPTSMLDPIAAREFMDLVMHVNDELGITILLVDHNQEEALSMVNRVLSLSEGQIAFEGTPREYAQWLYDSPAQSTMALPVAAQLYLEQQGCESREAASSQDIPLDVKHGRWWLWQNKAEAAHLLDAKRGGGVSSPYSAPHLVQGQAEQKVKKRAVPLSDSSSTVLEARHIWYRYSKESPYLLRDLSLKVPRGSILGIVGANASGKSTLLSLLSGTAKPQHGKVLQAQGKQCALLPQDPTALFIRDTISEDLMDHAAAFGYGESEVADLLKDRGLIEKKDRHPLDLSGGEQQKLALAKILLTRPHVLLLDEPTKGLDVPARVALRALLRAQVAEEKTVLMVSHDLEFVAATADECLMLFDGELVGRASTEAFFAGNMFYTTALQRLTQGIVEECPAVWGWPLLSDQAKQKRSVWRVA